MSALLTENGFIDNTSDAAKLKESAYIERIARGHVNGLARAFELEKKQATNPTTQPSDWAIEHIEELKRLGITDGSRPKDAATREEVMVMLNRLRKL